MKKLILPATIAAVMATAPLAATADVKLSGQINRMIANMDNGVDSELQHLDNDGSGTRIRLKGETDAGNGTMVGFYWETQYDDSNESSNADVRPDTSAQGDFDGTFETRHRDLYIKGGFGKVSIGQGDGAANGITEMEYTGTTYLTGYASPEDIWGSVTFANSGGLNVGDVYDGMDGLSRNDRLRYDSPKLGPVTISVDTGNGGKTEAAIRFATDLGDGGKLKGGYAFWDRKDAVAPNTTSEGAAGSIAYMHGSGFNGALVIGTLDTGAAQDPESTMVALGYTTGPHAVSLRLGTTDDKTAGVSADSTEIGYVNRSLKSAELYAGYQIFEIDVTGAEDITILFAGARVKF